MRLRTDIREVLRSSFFAVSGFLLFFTGFAVVFIVATPGISAHTTITTPCKTLTKVGLGPSFLSALETRHLPTISVRIEKAWAKFA